MEQDQDRVKDKIRKLLNLANDAGAFDGEIDNALRFARRMMMRHNISEADLNPTKDPHEIAADTEYKRAEAFTTGANWAVWESWLCQAVTSLIGTVGYYRGHKTEAKTAAGTLQFDARGQAKNATQAIFYGPAEDVAEAAQMFCDWSHVVATMARMKYGGIRSGDGYSYAVGFCTALAAKVARLEAAERAQITAGTASDTGTALVVRSALALVAAKKRAGAEWLRKEKGVNLTTTSSRGGHINAGAHAAGKADGAAANFSRDRRALRIGR